MAIERLTAVQYPYSPIAAANLQANRDALHKRTGKEPEYTPPAPGHYWDLYPWDQAFHSIIDARHGSPESLEAATKGLLTIFLGQYENGFIPNQQTLGPRRRVEPERWLGFEASECNYTQPPVWAVAAQETYQALLFDESKETDEAAARAMSFLQKIYPGLKLSFEYFDKYRRISPDNRLSFAAHPHETGRDSDPTYDYIKPRRFGRSGEFTPRRVDTANIILDYFHILHFGKKLKQAGADNEAKRRLFGAVDVMMNCMLADNLDVMSQLASQMGQATDEVYFYQYARDVEIKILTEMWADQKNDGEGGFYAQDNEGTLIGEVSISNLFPLVLPNLRDNQLESLLNLMNRSFNTPYPLPSVATDSPNYDPHNREFERLWRGPVWQNVNWYLVERGLKKRQQDPERRPDLQDRCGDWVKRISLSSRRLLELSGAREFYNPITAKGQRARVRNFGWSNLGYVM